MLPHRSFVIALTAITTCLTLASCGSARGRGAWDGPLTPLPEELLNVPEPSDETLAAVVKQYIADKGGPAATSYEFARIDLNGDRRRDALVIMRLPYMSWCTEDGCLMAVFRASDDDYTLASEIMPIRTPVTVSRTRTNGWRDILVRVDGHLEWKAKTVALRYNGDLYPLSPIEEPAVVATKTMADGITIFP